MPRFERGTRPVGGQLAKMDGFVAPPRAQHRVGDGERRQALVDHPCERRDAGSRQYTPELHGLVNRDRLGKRDEQDYRELKQEVGLAKFEGPLAFRNTSRW